MASAQNSGPETAVGRPRGGGVAPDGAPLRIAHVTTERGFGGGEVQVLLLMGALSDSGVEQVLVAPGESQIAQRATQRGHRVVPIGLRHTFDLASVWRLGRLLREVDIVHLHTGRASWLGSIASR